ncbi:MAG: cytochrome c-type biogenesis protein [Pseudomonadota bacterium]
MMAWVHTLVFCMVFAFITPAGAVGVDAETLADPAQEHLAQSVMAQLRCLVCQNQSIVDSDAPLAADLRGLVRTRVAAGDTPKQVKDYLVARYGDWVLLNPPLKSSTVLLWAAPIAALLFGCIGIVFARLSRKSAAVLSKDDAEAADAILGGDH